MFGDYSTTHAAILTRLAGRKRRTVATGTVISVGDDNIARVTYRGTDVVTALADGSVVLNTGGWPTKTTARRMNDYLPLPYRVIGSTLRRGVLPRKATPWRVVSAGGPVVPFLDTGSDGPRTGEPNMWTGQLGWGANTGHARMVAVLNTVTGEHVADAGQVAA